jgi:hypothetical protein
MSEPIYIHCTPAEWPTLQPVLVSLGHLITSGDPIPTNCPYGNLYFVALLTEGVTYGLEGFSTLPALGAHYSVTSFINKFAPKPLSNEAILTIFLDQRRLYSVFIHNLASRGTVPIREAIFGAFDWDNFDCWNLLNTRWSKLCDHFELNGTIDYNKLT